jgi:ribosomal protein S18 acetylase RimI-like enzyme
MARRIPPGPERDQFLPLLFLADDSHEKVRDERDDGSLFVVELGDATGVAQAVARAAGEVELTLVAVDEAHQGAGIGKQLIAATLAALADDGVRRVLVGTATSGTDQIAFYQKCGFRPLAIERDYFDGERGYPEGVFENGIRTRDLLWFDVILTESIQT